jgi:DNA-binding PadR family transcriptional regulator
MPRRKATEPTAKTPRTKSNRSKFAILGLLSQGAASGYDIRKQVDRLLSHFWNESYGQIYPILRELGTGGLASRKVFRQLGKPDRQEYSLTSRGEGEFADWLSTPAQFPLNRNETLLKVFFGDQQDPEALLAHIERYRDYHLAQLDALGELEKGLQVEEEENAALPFWMMTIAHEKAVSRSVLRWCDQIIEELESQASARKPKRRRS